MIFNHGGTEDTEIHGVCYSQVSDGYNINQDTFAYYLMIKYLLRHISFLSVP